jgi:hypothetical protein
MYKLWAKKIKNNRIVASVTARNKEDIPVQQKRDRCFKEICKKLDISVPLWLSKHEQEFGQFKYVVFYAEDFIDDIDFDKLEIELIDDGNGKSKNSVE